MRKVDPEALNEMLQKMRADVAPFLEEDSPMGALGRMIETTEAYQRWIVGEIEAKRNMGNVITALANWCGGTMAELAMNAGANSLGEDGDKLSSEGSQRLALEIVDAMIDVIKQKCALIISAGVNHEGVVNAKVYDGGNA